MMLFVRPSPEIFSDSSRTAYCGNFRSYSHYNYLRPGLIQTLKRSRFEKALALAKPFMGRGTALDFGCADGILLPSLARYFDQVLGVDHDQSSLSVAQSLVDANPLPNVKLICNADMSFEALREKVDRPFRVAFVLETLEHVGSLPNLYQSKADFLKSIFSLMEPDGIIIASVPRMVGVRFLIKYLIQTSLRIPTEKHQFGDLMRSSFLRDTSRLEPQWAGSHYGFNHLRLNEALKNEFETEVFGSLTSVFYRIRRKPAAGFVHIPHPAGYTTGVRASL
jgi:2-polyprenyl-3-methyl-5-hydroxy-6-metoxy-1,4-benzoquinol methylase